VPSEAIQFPGGEKSLIGLGGSEDFMVEKYLYKKSKNTPICFADYYY
jgi:hypothetical protein